MRVIQGQFIKVLLSLLCLFHHTQLFSAENSLKNKSIAGTFHYGYVWAHRSRIEHMTKGHTKGLELSWQTQTDGSKWWQRLHHYPQTGFSVMYFDLAYPEVVGNAAAIIGYINFPMIRSKNFFISLQTGAGVSYLTKKFDAVTDHKNMGIGSHVNSAVRMMLQTRYEVAKNISLYLNYGITHFSNAAYRLPNLGINNVSLAGGILYRFSEPEKFLTPEIPALDKRWITEVIYGAGVKENYPPDGKQFFAHTIYFQFLKPLSHKSRVCIGADGFYDLSLFRFVKDASSESDKRVKAIRSGIHAGYEMQVNRFTLLVHMGYYLVDHTKIDTPFYHRYGLKYDLGKRLFINLSLKTHWARADYAELGLGWRFRI
jgi:hypothetical protein